MNGRVVRAYEGVFHAARFVREVRVVGEAVERGVRLVYLKGGSPGAWRDLLAAVDKAECVRADREVARLFDAFGRARPETRDQVRGWPRLERRPQGRPRGAGYVPPRHVDPPPRRQIVRLRLDD